MLGMITLAQEAMTFGCYLVLLAITAFCAGKLLPNRTVLAVIAAIIAADLIEYGTFHQIGFRYPFAVSPGLIGLIHNLTSLDFRGNIEEGCIAFVVGVPLVAMAYAAVRLSSVVRLPRIGPSRRDESD